jgi:hypothetical protein
MREDHLGHQALVVRVNLNLATAVRPDKIPLLDERHDGCRVILYLVDHPGTPQLAVDDRDLAVTASGNGVVLAIDVHHCRLREHEVADNLAAIPAFSGFARLPRGAVKTAHLWAVENRTQVGGHFKTARLRSLR